MTAIVQHIENLKHIDLSEFTLKNDHFWNLLLLSCLMFSTLIAIPRLL